MTVSAKSKSGDLKFQVAEGEKAQTALRELNKELESPGRTGELEERNQALQRSQFYLSEGQRLTHTGSWALDRRGFFDYWSAELFRIYGLDPAQGPPTLAQYLALVHAQDRDFMAGTIEKMLAQESGCDVKKRIIRPDGALRHIRCVGVPLFDKEGVLKGFVGTAMDVTEQEELTQQLQRAEQELQQLVDLVPQLIAVAGPDGKFIHLNRMTREYTGLTLEEFRSVDVVGRAFHPDDLEKVRSERKRGFLGIDPFEYEARLLGKDGVYRWFLIRYNPLVEEGRVRRWFGTATEIESRKQEEERVRQENVRLEERTRIAQELHDTLLQSFCAASMKLGVATDALPSDSLLKPKIESIVLLMEQGLAEGRTAIQGLRSSDSGPSDLVVALSGIQKELGVQADMDFRVSVVGQRRPLRAPVGQEAYRIGREALVNAFSHSRAKRVELELEYTDSNLTVRVRDNGCGIAPQVLDRGREGHWGLAGMRERARKIGGLLKISSSATAGTEIQISIPGDVAFELSSPGLGKLRVM